MYRTSNLTDFEVYRRKYNNPLFDLFTDDFDDYFKEKKLSKRDVIRMFYVDARDGQIICQKSLIEKFKNSPKRIIKAVKDFDGEIKNSPGMVYLLLGKKGMGKTTILLKYFFDILMSDEESESTPKINIYIDLKSKKTDRAFQNGLPGTLIEYIFYVIKNEQYNICKYISDPNFIRLIDINYSYIDSDNDLQRRVLDNKEEAINFLFSWAKRNNIDINLIIDNIDDFSILSVKTIIDKATELKTEYNANCIIALRDYWSPAKLKIDDSNVCVFHLSKPDIASIFKKRLDAFKINDIKSTIEFMYGDHKIILNHHDVIEIFKEIIDDLESSSNKTIHEDIYRLNNYNTRDYLLSMYNFFHSPYLFSRANFIRIIIKKITEIDPNAIFDKPRKLKFFDFLENFMAIHSLCYDPISSNIFNLFFHDYEYGNGYNYRNTLIFIRILQALPYQHSSNMHKLELLELLKQIGYKNEPTINAINILFDNCMIASPDGINFDDSIYISLSDKGRLYMDKIITEWSYIVSICDAVPMQSKFKVDINVKFGEDAIPLSKGSLFDKNTSAKKFITFIHEEELEERKHIRSKRIHGSITGNKMLYFEIQQEVHKTIQRLTSFKSRKNSPVIDFKLHR